MLAWHVVGRLLGRGNETWQAEAGMASMFVIMYKENYKLIHVCWIPQIDNFITIMEQYFHY